MPNPSELERQDEALSSRDLLPEDKRQLLRGWLLKVTVSPWDSVRPAANVALDMMPSVLAALAAAEAECERLREVVRSKLGPCPLGISRK